MYVGLPFYGASLGMSCLHNSHAALMYPTDAFRHQLRLNVVSYMQHLTLDLDVSALSLSEYGFLDILSSLKSIR